MSSETRKLNAFDEHMTFAEVVDVIQSRYHLTVTGVAETLGLQQGQLRAHVYAGVPMDSKAAVKLSNQIRQTFGDERLSRRS